MITDLKSKLPLGKKKAQDDELDENEEVETASQDDATGATDISEVEDNSEESTETGVASQSLVYKLKAKLQALQKKGKKSEDAGEEDEEASSSDAAAKKKKRSKMIQIAIGACLVVFLLSDYIIPTEEPAVPEGGESASFKRPDRKKKPKTDTAVTDTPAEAKTDTAATDTPTTDAATTDAATTDTPSDSPVTVTSEDVPTGAITDPTTDTATTDTTTDTTVTDTPVDASTTDSTTTDTTTDTATTDTTITDTPITDTPITTDTPVDQGTVDTIDGGETTIPGEDNLTDQILQDLENQAKTAQPTEQKKDYVSPPDYEYRGRGLVYNCAGKHWACVDAPSYKTCEDNASSVKYLKKKTECHPFNVYETPKGCENMQNRMVSSSAKTAFCAD